VERAVGERLRVAAVTDAAALKTLTDDWSTLLARSASNRPTQAPLWLLAWWRVFGRSGGRQLATALIYDGPRLVGLAPFLRRVWWHRQVIPFRRLELLATGESEEDEILSDYLGVIAERGYEEAVAGTIAHGIAGGALGACDEVMMSALDGEAPMGEAMERAFARRGIPVERTLLAPSYYIKLPTTWDAYLGGLSGSGRYLVTRSLRDFDRWAGSDAQHRRVTSLADLDEGKQVLVKLHQQRWQAAGQSGVFASRLFSRFHDAVLPGLLALGALDLSWLSVRGQPVAVAYSIVWDNKVLFYQGGRTLEVPKGVRPGIVLHARSIRAAIEAGRSEYDFLPGTAQYKQQLATASRPLVQIRATRAPLRHLARAAMERGVAYIRQRRSPATDESGPSPQGGEHA
jgi:CelD/BcsL family acetyltransferase involved in cellulose biosynthesis